MLLTRLISRLLVRLLPLLLLLSAALPALGGRPLRDDPAWHSFGFAVCNLPCYVGVTPGRTPFNEMPDMLHRALPLIGNRMFYAGTAINFWASLPSDQLAGWARNEQGLVTEIRLTASLPFDHLLTQLGPPSCVLTGTQRAPILFWVQGVISIGAVLGVNARDFSPDNRVSTLWMRRSQTDDCTASGAQTWHGFARVLDYVH